MWPQLWVFLLPTWCEGLFRKSELPSFPVTTVPTRTAQLERNGKWWVQVGDRIYHAPPEASGLSGDVAHYYYAFGSESALPAELRHSRVGGQGRLHVFHIPPNSWNSTAREKLVALQTGSRRSSLSYLHKLTHGINLSTHFPVYRRSESYKNPLAATGHLTAERLAVDSLTPDRIYEFLLDITQLPEKDDPSRSTFHRKASATVVQFLQETFQDMGLVTCTHSFMWRGFRLSNVIGYVPGIGPDTVTLGAHYDSRPMFDVAPGANDNGSGLALLLAISEAFMKTGVMPRKTVYFVAFAGEEQGLLGSKAFAADLASQSGAMPKDCRAAGGHGPSFLHRKAHHEAIIMDEVGWRSQALSGPTVNMEAYDMASSILDHLAQSSAAHNGNSLLVTYSNHPFGSDHMSFLKNGMPAVLTINGDDEGYPYYHKSTDTINHVDKRLMYLIGRMNMGALLRVAGVRGVSAHS